MDNKDTETQLRELCTIIIKELKKAKNSGLISENEYKKHIKNKVEFLIKTNRC